MANQFVPHKPQEVVIVKITKKEAVAIQILREHSYGDFTIVKFNGEIEHVLVNARRKITGDEELSADIKINEAMLNKNMLK